MTHATVESLEKFYQSELKVLARAEADNSSDLPEHRAEVEAIRVTLELLKERVSLTAALAAKLA
jgi:hypothetical protein